MPSMGVYGSPDTQYGGSVEAGLHVDPAPDGPDDLADPRDRLVGARSGDGVLDGGHRVSPSGQQERKEGDSERRPAPASSSAQESVRLVGPASIHARA